MSSAASHWSMIALKRNLIDNTGAFPFKPCGNNWILISLIKCSAYLNTSVVLVLKIHICKLADSSDMYTMLKHTSVVLG